MCRLRAFDNTRCLSGRLWADCVRLFVGFDYIHNQTLINSQWALSFERREKGSTDTGGEIPASKPEFNLITTKYMKWKRKPIHANKTTCNYYFSCNRPFQGWMSRWGPGWRDASPTGLRRMFLTGDIRREARGFGGLFYKRSLYKAKYAVITTIKYNDV